MAPTRDDKRAVNFRAAITIAAILLWLAIPGAAVLREMPAA